MKIDADEVFAECTRQLGGVVADDTRAPNKPDNADFAFVSYKVVAELKRMEQSFWGQKEFQHKLSILATGWVQRRLVPPDPARRRTFELSTLPRQCQREFTDLLKSKLLGYFKDANRQIKATKAELGMPDARGVLILVNDGNALLPPRLVRYLSALLLAKKFTAINTVLHVVCNLEVSAPGHEEPFRIWSAWGVRRETDPPEEFLEDLRAAYLRVLDSRGHPATSAMGTLEMFDRLELRHS